jgi:hypothetical protein
MRVIVDDIVQLQRLFISFIVGDNERGAEALGVLPRVVAVDPKRPGMFCRKVVDKCILACFRAEATAMS